MHNQAWLMSLAIALALQNAAAFGQARIKSELVRCAKVVKQSGIKPE